MWDAIKRFFKWLWELIRKLFGGNKEDKTVLKITVLIVLLFSLIACSSYKELKSPIIQNESQFIQRTQLEYVTLEFDQVDADRGNVTLWNFFYNDSNYVIDNDSSYYPGEWPDTNLTKVYVPDSGHYHITYKLFKPFKYKAIYDCYIDAVFFANANEVLSTRSDTIQVLFFREDLNNDKRVDGLDLIELVRLTNWGKTNAKYRDFADINGDGNIDGLDLIQLVKPENWGQSWTPTNN